jgi:glycosyltransferase involved in cell wall biosynthesis
MVRLARRENCGLVFATFPEDHLIFAACLAARRLKLPFFPYFHNTYRENRRGLSRVLAGYVQRRILRQARLTFVMSDGLKTELEHIYPDLHFKPLVHMSSEPIPRFERLPTIDSRHVRIGYLGNVNDSNLDALRRFCELVQQSPAWRMDLFSSVPEWQLRKHGLLGERVRHEQPADEELLSRLASYDILFLPHGLTGGLAPIEYRTIFPTRTIPYLLSGRPIIAHTAKESFLTKWLRHHDCAEVVDCPDPAELRAAVERLCSNPERREQLVCNALRAANQFHAPAVVDELTRTINRFSE